ncbi:S-adenosyl-L-methionine-dependent methyltransferase [Phytophthora cactorum]|nr:S-adenosyl-L-methionine-dependent methyltransferase [Phytophthora cactorum]
MEAEDNVVGALFLQNGEDNGYDPEDFVQELDVGGSAPHFRISVADDDGGIPGSLFACAVWNGARFIAMHFAKHPELVERLSLVEFGAASALPSLVGLHFGAKVAVMTDYPNDLLLKNIEANIQRNERLLGSGRREVRGHLWGSDTTGLLKFLVVRRSLKQLKTRRKLGSMWRLLPSACGCMIGHEQHDLSFFTKAKKLYGFDAVHLDTLASPHIFNADRIVDQYLYVLTRSVSTRHLSCDG